MSWTITTLNLNGIRASLKRGFAEWLAEASPDVLCLQELRMQAADMGPEHRPPVGWAGVQTDAERKGYAGAAIWSQLPPTATSVGVGLPDADAEGRVVRMDLEPATVLSVYLPSGSSGPERQAKKEVFMDHFLRFSAGLLAEGRPVVMCGDWNIAHTGRDIHNPKGNAKNSGFLPHERAWVDAMLAQGWVDVFRALHPSAQTYSWWSNRGQARALDRGWRLDYHLCSPDLAARAEDAWILPPARNLSDHAPVTVRFR